MPKLIECAGGVVFGPQGVALVTKHPNPGNNGRAKSVWSFPKGKVEESDNQLVDAAIREIMEETSIKQLERLAYLGSFIRENGDGDVWKRISLFLFRTSSAHMLDPPDTKMKAQWHSRRQVSELLSHPADRLFYELRVNERLLREHGLI